MTIGTAYTPPTPTQKNTDEAAIIQGLTAAEEPALAQLQAASTVDQTQAATLAAGAQSQRAALGLTKDEAVKQALLTELGSQQQGAALSKQQAAELAQYGLQGQITGAGLANPNQGITEQQTALSQANTQNQLAELAYNEPGALRTQAGAAAAAGASNTFGNQQAQAGIKEQYGVNSEALKNTLTGLGLTQSENVLQAQIAGYGQKSEEAGYTQQQQAIANAAKNAGISVEQAQAQYQSGLSQIGVQFDPTALAQNAASNQAQASQIGFGILSSAAALGGLPLQPLTSALKGK